MPEIRRHPITGAPILLAPERGHRPGAWFTDSARPAVDAAGCPFCPGNEEATPPELERVGSSGAWEMRVVPNKYPAISPDSNGPAHEVLIETSDHHRTLERCSDADLRQVLELWRDRSRLHSARETVRYVNIFRNEGVHAGQSIQHPHSQLISLPFVPPRIEEELAAFRRARTCPLCAVVRRELADLRRAIASEGDAVLFCPEGSRFPYEMWVTSDSHHSAWETFDSDALAPLLGVAVRALRARWRGVSFNLEVITAPLRTEGSEAFHWYVEVVPRLASFAGYEIATGGYVNIVEPERAASELRSLR